MILLLYISGLVLYSSLFVLSDNQNSLVQLSKIPVAALHCLIFVIPIFLAQSRSWIFRILGYVILVSYFLYVFFLTGYFSYFGFVPEIYALGADNADDFTGVAGHYFIQVFSIKEVVLIVSAVLFFYLLPKQRIFGKSMLVVLLPLGLLGASIVTFGMPSKSADWGNATVIRRFGLPTFYYISLRERLSFGSGYLAEDTPFPGNLTEVVDLGGQEFEQSPEAQLDVVRRVILVQIESFDREAIDATLAGEPVMPFVSNLRDTSCRDFADFHTIKSVGGSSDSEFSVATGRLPSARIQSLRNADFSRMTTLYEVLAGAGVDPYFSHNNNVGFYGRNFAYGQMPDVTTSFTRPGTPVRERDFAVEQLSSALSASNRLFYYFFNFQSHGPFQGYSPESKDRFRLPARPDLETSYMATMYDVDQTIAAMFALQQGDFDQGDSLFILTSDHPSGLHHDGTALGRSRIPLMMCHASFDGAQVDNVGSTVNLFPTVLDAFDIPHEDVAIADSLLGDTPRVVLFPSRTTLHRGSDGELISEACTDACNRFFDYTDQAVRISN